MSPAPIVHLTDLTGDDGAAFVHAVALAAASRAPLVTVHGNAAPEVAMRLPDAAPLAARWGVTVEHRRTCHACCDDVTDTLLDAVHRLAPRLVIAGSHGRHGLRALLHGNVSEELARNLTVPLLVVPNRGRGFVDERGGDVDLRRIVIAAGDAETAAHGLRAARDLAALAGVAAPDLVAVHAGDEPVEVPGAAGVRWRRHPGPVEDAIADAVRAEDACVLVMSTRGHDGLRDVLFGSHTDHALRDASCPVLVTPARATPA